MEIALYIFLVINICGLACIIWLCTRDNMWAPLLYPAIEEILDTKYKASEKTRNAVKIAFTVVCLPVVLLYFICLTAYIALVGIYALISEIIEENKKE
jgi:hypothetical protein